MKMRNRERKERRRLRKQLEKEVRRMGGKVFLSEGTTVEHLEIMLRQLHDCPHCRKLREEGTTGFPRS